ncbi:MAG: hypothetical protein NTX73_10220 [Rhodobacterales bacterium]|nr:hypothetical protein [Rhodobacterales bacterium]
MGHPSDDHCHGGDRADDALQGLAWPALSGEEPPLSGVPSIGYAAIHLTAHLRVKPLTRALADLAQFDMLMG